MLLACVIAVVVGALTAVAIVVVVAGALFLLVLAGRFTPDSLLNWGTRPGEDLIRGQDRMGEPPRL